MQLLFLKICQLLLFRQIKKRVVYFGLCESSLHFLITLFMRGKFSFLYVGIWFDVTKCDKSPYSVRIRENTDQNNSEYGHILCSGYHYFPWQSKYFNLKTNCHIKPKFFVKTKLRDNLLHAKYLISVHVALTLKLFHYF